MRDAVIVQQQRCGTRVAAAAQAFRGFAGTSILILVGVATDTARRVKAEQAMQRYRDVDKLYDDV